MYQDARTDIFAFGSLLFECLTGTRAFPGRTPPDVITATLRRRAGLEPASRGDSAEDPRPTSPLSEEGAGRADPGRCRGEEGDRSGAGGAAAYGSLDRVGTNRRRAPRSQVRRSEGASPQSRLGADSLHRTGPSDRRGRGRDGRLRAPHAHRSRRMWEIASRTRLAPQLRERFQEGVFLVELGAVTVPELVPQAVASVFEVRDESGIPLEETLFRHLRAKAALLTSTAASICSRAAPSSRAG